jgi:hypothetical protein
MTGPVLLTLLLIVLLLLWGAASVYSAILFNAAQKELRARRDACARAIFGVYHIGNGDEGELVRLFVQEVCRHLVPVALSHHAHWIEVDKHPVFQDRFPGPVPWADFEARSQPLLSRILAELDRLRCATHKRETHEQIAAILELANLALYARWALPPDELDTESLSIHLWSLLRQADDAVQKLEPGVRLHKPRDKVGREALKIPVPVLKLDVRPRSNGDLATTEPATLSVPAQSSIVSSADDPKPAVLQVKSSEPGASTTPRVALPYGVCIERTAITSEDFQPKWLLEVGMTRNGQPVKSVVVSDMDHAALSAPSARRSPLRLAKWVSRYVWLVGIDTQTSLTEDDRRKKPHWIAISWLPAISLLILIVQATLWWRAK